MGYRKDRGHDNRGCAVVAVNYDGSYSYESQKAGAEVAGEGAIVTISTFYASRNFTSSVISDARLPSTTILGENMIERVIPFAESTGARTLPFGASAEEWANMTFQQRYKLNDGILRMRINEGDNFRYIGEDPLRSPDVRSQFDLTRSELLRLQDRKIPYEIVPQSEVQSILNRP